MENLFLPQGLDLAPVFVGESPLTLSYAYLFLHCFTRKLGQVVKWDDRARDFIDLHSSTLRSWVPKLQLAIIKQRLVAAGILAIMPSYLAGDHSMGYKLLPPWDERHFIAAPLSSVISDKGKAAKIGRQLQTIAAQDVRTPTPIHKALFDTLSQLQINQAAAREYSSHLTCKPKPLSKLSPQQRTHLLRKWYNAVISGIANQQWFFKPDIAGRCHHNFTICPRDIRPFVTLNGSHLTKLDISSAQAFIIGILYERQRNIGKLPNNQYGNRESLFPMLSKTEVASYFDLVCSGKFYQIWESVGGYRDRAAAKQGFVSYLNDMENKKYFEKGYKIMSKICPTIADFHKSFLGKFTAEGKSELSLAMQGEEADFIIHDVCVRLNQQDPTIPLLTVHDCIATTPEHADTVLATMRKTALERYGVSPDFKSE